MDRVGRRHADVTSGSALLALGIAYGIGAFRIPSGQGEPGPGFMPLVLAVLLGVLSLYILVRGLRRPRLTGAGRFGSRSWSAVLATAAYALLFQPLGFVVSTLAYTSALTRVFTSERRWLVAVPVGVTLALYLLFRVALGVRLPPGLLG